MELGEVEACRDVFGPDQKRAFVGPLLELGLADDPVDETEIVGPAELAGLEPLGIDECDLRRVGLIMGDVVGAELSVGLGESAVRARCTELGDTFLEGLQAPSGRILHGRQVGQGQRSEFRTVDGTGLEWQDEHQREDRRPPRNCQAPHFPLFAFDPLPLLKVV